MCIRDRCYLRSDLDGTLFEGQTDSRIIKGKRLFEHPVSMDIAKACARLCQDRIRDKMRSHYSKELFFSEYHGKYFSFEVLNVRAERRESRDLMQDLEDIRNGIQIVHASDMEKQNSEEDVYKRQVGSCSNLGDAQARRLKIRVNGENGKYFAHTLNNTVVAPPRMLIAFLENNLQADGSVRIPAVLQPYMGGMTEIK